MYVERILHGGSEVELEDCELSFPACDHMLRQMSLHGDEEAVTIVTSPFSRDVLEPPVPNPGNTCVPVMKSTLVDLDHLFLQLVSVYHRLWL